MALAPPEGGLLCPPPKLRRKSPKPIPGNSEASYGLSVQVQLRSPFTEASVIGSPVIWSLTSLTFRHLAGVSPHTWSYDFAETCVFGKQSPEPSHNDLLCEEAPLLSKLRGYFAEFLRESCLVPLEPASSGFEWHFTPNHNLSTDSSTLVSSDLLLVSPKLHLGHGQITQACDQSLEPPPTAWELTVSCSISIPDEGSFHPSLTGTTSLSVTQEYFAFQGGHC
ncbi:hypothetical protein glysoja_035408 [Glycine soja]|uniref:Uncharacterized protein n=1 Tax=Glycine soja TaxID=3848 RepID=A0A0B2P353_GLYSO|nr:hypothetical protein glysoja_035408 [Glycine soja]